MGLVWALCALVAISAQGSFPTDCGDPIKCWLESLVIALPDFEADGFTFTSMELYNMDVAAIESSYVSPTSVDIQVDGMTASLKGHYEKSSLIHGKMTGSVSHATFGMVVLMSSTYLNEGKDQVPDGISFSSCSFDSIKVKVSLDMGLDHPIVDVALQNEIKKHFCTDLGDFLATNVTDLMQKNLDPALVEIMDSKPSETPSSYFQEDFLDWNEILFGPIHSLLDRFVSSEFMTCFLGSHPDILAPYSASILDGAMNLLTNGTGTVYFNLSDSQYVSRDDLVLHLGPNVTMEIQTALVSGLNSYSDVEILLPTNTSTSSGTSLSVSLTMDRLDMNFSSITYVNGHTGDDDSMYHYSEDTLWMVSLRNLKVSYDMDVAVNGTFVSNAYVDQLLTPACILESLRNVSLSSLVLQVDVADVVMFEVEGEASTLEANTVSLMDNVFKLLTQGFGDFTSGMIQGISQSVLREKLNGVLAKALASQREALGQCPAHVSHAGQTDYVVWAQSVAMSALDRLVNYQEHAARLMNKAVNCLSDNTGTITFNNVSDAVTVSVGGLNSFTNLALLQPVAGEDYQLHSSIGVGMCDASLLSEEDIPCSSPLSILIRAKDDSEASSDGALYGAIKPHLHSLSSSDRDALKALLLGSGIPATTASSNSNAFLEIEMSALNVSTVSAVQLNMDTLLDFEGKSLAVDGCAVSTIQSVEVQSLSLGMDDVKVVIGDNDGGDGNTTRDVTSTFEKFVPIITAAASSFATSYIGEQLVVAEETCADGGVAPSSLDDDSSAALDLDTVSWQWQIGLIAVGSLVALVLFVFHHRYLDHLKQVAAVAESENGGSDDRESWQGGAHQSTAIVFDRRIPLFVRLLLPLSICGTSFLFIQSNMSTDPVSVWATVTIEGVTLPSMDVFSFTLAGTVQDMWDAGVYPLSALISFFSGGWPYIKLLAMFASLLCPPSLLSMGSRDTLLKFVDAYGKWSLVDFFVMCMFLCAFYFDMKLGHVRGSPDIEVVLRVVPTFGFYGFLLATLISLGQGHLVLAMHRFVYDGEQPPLHLLEGRENMAQHSFAIPLTSSLRDRLVAANGGSAAVVPRRKGGPSGDAAGDASLAEPLNDDRGPLFDEPAVEATLTRRGIVLLVAFYLLAFFAIFTGVYAHSFNFKFEGLTGLLLGQDSEIGYSVVSISEFMVTDSGLDNDLSMRWMQASFVTVCIAMPLATIISILWLWVGPPLSITLQKSLFLFAEVTNAWCALDVFCISLIAAILEIKQFAAFMVGDACDGLNVLLAEYLDSELDGDDKCFDVETTLTDKVSLLFLAMVIIFFLNNISLWLAEISLTRRIQEAAALFTGKTVADRDGDGPLKPASTAELFSPLHATNSSAESKTRGSATHTNTGTGTGNDKPNVQSADSSDNSTSNTTTTSSSSSVLSLCARLVKRCMEAVNKRLIVALWSVQAIELTYPRGAPIVCEKQE